MRLILLILVFVSSLLLAGKTAFAGISTKKQDILKLIGTTEASNGKFAWVEINGEDYGWTREGRNIGKNRIVMVEMGKVKGWTREGRNIGKYRIVMVEMGKVKLELFGRIVKLKLLPEDAQWAN